MTALRGRPAAAPVALTAFRLTAPLSLAPLGWAQRLPGWALVLLGLAAATDALDGALARRTGGASRLGAVLDLWADKAWVAVVLVLLVHAGTVAAVGPALILARETLVMARRRHLAARGLDLPPTPRSKAKTAIQMSALWLLLALPTLPGRAALLWAVTLYTGATGLELLLRRPVLRSERGVGN